jgi:predicted nucleotidyltransferase
MFEGWHLVTNKNGIEIMWVVKGYEHPEEGFISIPYRLSGHRVKFNEFNNYIQEYYKYLDCVGRYVPVVRNEDIFIYYDPKETYFNKKDFLPEKIKDLIKYLNPEYIGLIGSYAFGLQRENSDVDLLLYGNNKEIYEKLLELRNRNLILNCVNRYNKVSDTMSYENYKMLSNLRVLDSCYTNIPYTIRILRQVHKTRCISNYKTLGNFKGEIEIYDNNENYLVPSIYLAENENYGKVEIMTWHTRYSELPLGKYIIEGFIQLDLKRNKLVIIPDLGGRVDPIKIWT